MPPILENSRHLRFDSLPGSHDQVSMADSIYETKHRHGQLSLDNSMNITQEVKQNRDAFNSRSVDRQAGIFTF